MGALLRWLIWCAGAFVLSLRYRVHVTGLDKVRGLKKAIILPNHPGLIDPPLVLKTLWPSLRPRPMVLESVFRNPLLFWLPRALDAVKIPDLEQPSAEARQQAQDAIRLVIDGLGAGYNHIFWPAGRIYRHAGRESLGAARSLAEVISAVPDAQLVVVRTRGVWGSMFSFARTGQAPNLARCLLKGVGILIANGVFFAPRRHVSITVERIDRRQLPGLSREQVNAFFEAWYNAPGTEDPSYVPYHWLLGSRTYEFPKSTGPGDIDLSAVTPQTRGQIAEFIAEKLKREPTPADQEPDTGLEELGLDSLDRMELSLEVERRFGFRGNDVPITIGELWALAEGRVQQTAAPPAPAPPSWFGPLPTGFRAGVLAETMAEALVRRAIAWPSQPAMADDISGLLTYRRFLTGALLLSRRLARLPAPNIGLMLPAGAASNMLFFAAHLAGKLPVMLNWTTGPANLAHAAQVMGLSHVVTSKKFIDRAGISVEGTQYLFVEDLKNGIGKVEMLRMLARVRFRPGSVLRTTPKPRADAPAVVLFTSGSEKAPKAVPLTHTNILSNVRAALETYELRDTDSLVGFLPPFHSFGLTVTTVLPVLGGYRVVYHPDPTDATGIVRKIAAYRSTIICGTPTFLSYVFDRAKGEELRSLRIAAAGAEKLPEALYQRIAQLLPQLKVLEGYGITECSPIVSCNRLDHIKPGSIGLPFLGVKVRVVDAQTQAPLPVGTMGMLWVSGPGVFPGYIGPDAPDPFVEADGQRWYVTGDLVRIDEDGFLWFCGRLKRFLKAGGEMISLPAIEEPFAQRYPPTDKGPRVAVEGVESDNGRQIVLFTTEPITLREANETLQSQGLRGILRIDEVRRVEKIPVLGTGKTDYKVLRAQIQAGGGAATN